MTSIVQTTSGLLNTQLPEFIVENNPNFVAFLKAYYQWLEDSNNGAVLYHTRNLLSYKDLDKTTDEFIQYFINDFLPYFPQDIVADERKLIKAAREFYLTKGSENSLKFLFRVLYNQDVEVFYPKDNILKASDGKWQVPQAVKILITSGGYPSVNVGPNFDPSLLVKRQGTGSQSNATCTIESAIATVDPDFGFEIFELYLSNIQGVFVAEENLMVDGVYANTESFHFEQKIIGSLSNVIVNPTYQGLNYNGPTYNFDGTINYPGDPVVIFGGLANTAQATKAVAYVNNVSVGSIYAVGVASGGWGYRTFPNTIVTVVSDSGVGANVVVQSVDYINVNANSIFINTDSIEYRANATIEYYSANYSINAVTTSSINYAAAVSKNKNYIVLPSFYNYNSPVYNNFNPSATIGQTIDILAGTSSGDSRTITSYSPPSAAPAGETWPGGAFFVNSPFTSIPDTTSEFGIVGSFGTTTQTVNLNTATFQANTTIDNYYKNYYLQVVAGTGVSATPNVAIIQQYFSANQLAILGAPYLGATLDATSNVMLYALNYYGFSNNQLYINHCTGSGNTHNTVNLSTTTFTPVPQNGYYNNSIIEFVSGTGKGSAGIITAYFAANSVAVFTPIPQTPPLANPPDATTNAVIFYENANSKIGNSFTYVNTALGKITTMNVVSGGYGFKSVPTLTLDSQFETDFSSPFAGYPDATDVSEHANTVQSFRDVGHIANVQIISGGTGYDPTKDVILVNSSVGYNAAFTFTTSGSGVIQTVSVINPGEGYAYPISVTTPLIVANSVNHNNPPSGTGAQLVAYGFDEGANFDVSVSDIGKIYDFRIVSRGFDYQTTPNVSLAIIDMPVCLNLHSNLLTGSGTTTTAVNLYSTIFAPSTINNYYQGSKLQIIAGTGSGTLPNSAIIRDYNGNTFIANLVTALAVAPDPTSNIVLYNANVAFNYPALQEDDFVYQGANAKFTTFSAFFDKFGSQYAGLLSNSQIRLYNYTGTLSPSSNLVFANAGINVTPVLNVTSGGALVKVYGNGRGRANAQFFNGVIQYPGYYLNTDGQLSSDQFLQANTEFHNFSYIVQVQKALNDYKSALLQILHPSGMEVLSYMSIPDDEQNQISTRQTLSTTSNGLSGTVTSNPYSSIGTLVGTSTHFTSNAQVGDFVVLSAGSLAREQVKVITSITDDTHLTMESNTKFLGPGYLETINYSSLTYGLNSFANTKSTSTVNMNASNFIANTKIDNFYNNSLIEVTGGSGFVTNSFLLLANSVSQTTTKVNLNSALYAANTNPNFYNGYFLQVVDGTGKSATPNSANIIAYYGANQIAVLDAALGVALDTTSNVIVYAPNTATIVSYTASNQIAVLNNPLIETLDSTSTVLLTIPSVSNTFVIMPPTENVYGQILVGDAISFDLGIANTLFNANVVYVSQQGNALSVDTPAHLLTTNVANQSYYIYPQLNSVAYTFINNQVTT